MADRKKLNEQYMRAGFNAGWAAAHLSLADMADKEGRRVAARWMRERAGKPDKLEIAEDPAPQAPPASPEET